MGWEDGSGHLLPPRTICPVLAGATRVRRDPLQVVWTARTRLLCAPSPSQGLMISISPARQLGCPSGHLTADKQLDLQPEDHATVVRTVSTRCRRQRMEAASLVRPSGLGAVRRAGHNVADDGPG